MIKVRLALTTRVRTNPTPHALGINACAGYIHVGLRSLHTPALVVFSTSAGVCSGAIFTDVKMERWKELYLTLF